MGDMEHSMPLIGDDGELPWSDGHSTASDDNSSILFPSSSIWTPSSSMTRLEAGQLSPISTELEPPLVDSASCADSVSLHSRKTSCASTWSTSYGGGAEGDEVEHDGQWDQEQVSNDMVAIPKLEPTEDEDFCMDDLKEAPRTPSTATMVPKAKRPRGRPRKHPLTAQVASNKVTKGRSKTGCITCRRRKKKCDEAKPRCMNCEKNAVVCEGYNEKTLWKSGREKAEEERQAHQNLVSITMQPLFRGVETPEDMVFFNHYINHLSGVLTVESQHKNAFKDMLLQMAVEHRGLMHSILALASKHIDYDTPYGMKILSSNSKVSPASLLARSEFHHQQAMTKLYEDIAREGNKDVAPAAVNLAARYGQMLCLLLQSKAEGAHNGEHRVHLQAYKNLIQNSPPSDSAFLVFITEFFQLHIFADELIRFPDSAPRLAVENWEPWMPIQPARLIGVGDGLFGYLTQITTIRNTIRINIQAGVDPVVDYASLYRAAEIDAAIREWAPHWPPGDSRERVGLLYKQTMWVYLFRTIYPPSASSSSVPFAPSALAASVPSLAPRPPLSPTSPTHSVHSQPTEHSKASHASSSRAESPAPIRYPPHHDSRITIAVDESLAILDSIKPSDPVQTLLLIPCLVIGCSCFAPNQQAKIRDAIRSVRGYTGLRNCDLVQDVLEEVWQLMKRGDWARVWDWQGVARDLGLDFSCA